MSRQIKTARLLLRPLGTGDLYSTHAYASDPENTKYMMFLPNDSLEETAVFLKQTEQEWEKSSPQTYEFAITKDGVHIGAISLYMDETRETAEFGWVLNKRFWRQGYTYEAAAGLLDHAVKAMGIRHFIACCDSENKASYQLMEKLGMQRIRSDGVRKNRGSDEERKELVYELWVTEEDYL